MHNFIDYIKSIPFWRFVFLFVFIAIVLSEILVIAQSYLMYGELARDLLIVGFFTSAIDAFIVVFLIAVILEQLKRQDALLSDRANILEEARKNAESGLKDSEKKYKTLFENMAQGAFYQRADGVLVDCNPAVLEMFGLTVEEFVGRTSIDPPWKVIHEDGSDFPGEQHPSMEALRTCKPVRDVVAGVFNPRLDKYIWLNINAIPQFKKGEDRPYQVFVTLHDITERKRAETENIRIQKELIQAQKMQSLGQLAGGIAHDFNNILAIILGHAELAQNYVQDDKTNKLAGYIEQVKKAGERGKELIKQMLTFSRNQGGDIILLHPSPLVKEDLKMLRSTIPSSIEINSDIQPDLPAIKTTPVMLNQLLINLCVNARDAMGQKGMITVHLGMARDVKEVCSVCHKPVKGDWVELSVSDNGSGIDMDVIERIFEPFYTTKEVGMGTGMGLAMVSGIMSNCGGHTIVETKTGAGTTFRLLFPLVS